MADATGGRFALGIGASSDRIVEGWNDMPFERPLAKVSATVDFLRDAFAGDRTSTGFKLEQAPAEPLADHPRRPTRARCCGWRSRRPTAPSPTSCRCRACSRSTGQLDGAPTASSSLCRFFCLPGQREQVEPLARFMFSSYITVPVYENFFRWLGHGDEIDEMVELWAAKDRQAAAAAAPWELIEDTFIFGEPEEMRERLDALRRGRDHLADPHPDHDARQAQAELIEALAPS